MARTSPQAIPPTKTVIFTGSSIFHYPPFLWGDEPEEEWEEDEYESYDEAEGMEEDQHGLEGMEPDDGMSWEDGAAEEEQRKVTTTITAPQQQSQQASNGGEIQSALRSTGRSPANAQQVQQSAIRSSPNNGNGAPTNAQAPSQQAQLGIGLASGVRPQPSRERISSNGQNDVSQSQQQQNQRVHVDPAEATGTRQLSVTPAIARGPDPSQASSKNTSSALASSQTRTSSAPQRMMSADSLNSTDTAKRGRDEAGNESDVSSKKGKSSSKSSDNGKLRKGRSTPDGDESGGESSKEKKKKSGMFSGLFSSRKKDKKDKDSKKNSVGVSSMEETGSVGRMSEDSGASQLTASPGEINNNNPTFTPPTSQNNRRSPNSGDVRRSAITNNAAQPKDSGARGVSVSPHGMRVQQADLQQQMMYQQYLNRSPASPPDASTNYGLQTAATQPHLSTHLSPSNSLNLGRMPNGRPGSLILSPSAVDGAVVPELSVMRVFAGERLQSEATFKTVLLNTSTTGSDLIKQAMQRFRLPHGEDENDYYLTVKQYEGEEAELKPDEHPLVVFEELVESAMNMLPPTIKRSSISSISSNLSTHPAITKLGMNDFTDDTTVKFYLNRKVRRSEEDESAAETNVTSSLDLNDRSMTAEDNLNRDSLGDLSSREDEAHTSFASSVSINDPIASTLGKLNGGPRVNGPGRPHLSINTGPGAMAERFSSPTARFALQIVIYPEDLPDGLVFDPQTEAIIPRNSLQSRANTNASASPGVSQTHRKKVFVIPKNTTVAEVIEQSLDMFGIQEGVVDGGDEVEDKVLKRRNSSRVRYGLAVVSPGEPERELQPSSKVLEAFTRPPAFKVNNRRSADLRRRSLDSSQLLGTMDDVQHGDPVFVLRKAISYRTSSHSKNRLSAPLDDLALKQLHRDLSSPTESTASEYTQMAESPPPIDIRMSHDEDRRLEPKPISRLELIAAQRAASRANQRALLTAQSNSEKGVDLVIPDKGTIRSTRSVVDETVRYSYIDPVGETYDISDLIEEELWDGGKGGSKAQYSDSVNGRLGSNLRDGSRRSSSTKTDLLEDVLVRPQNEMEQTINQVFAKIKDGKAGPKLSQHLQDGAGRRSPSSTSTGGDMSVSSRSNYTKQTSRSNSPINNLHSSSSRGPTPSSRSGHQPHQPSIESVMSDSSSPDLQHSPSSSNQANKPPLIMKDDFGLAKMMAVIELAAAAKKPPRPTPISQVDELLFGPTLNLDDLHPQARELFGPAFKELEDMDRQLDLVLQSTFRP
ncbi:hypothetical protein FRC02_004245 [Tulasnella sp. 418]|nr:hypothetical protein FRC02_004245 [Tulasnella sp. 418]